MYETLLFMGQRIHSNQQFDYLVYKGVHTVLPFEFEPTTSKETHLDCISIMSIYMLYFQVSKPVQINSHKIKINLFVDFSIMFSLEFGFFFIFIFIQLVPISLRGKHLIVEIFVEPSQRNYPLSVYSESCWLR